MAFFAFFLPNVAFAVNTRYVPGYNPHIARAYCAQMPLVKRTLFAITESGAR